MNLVLFDIDGTLTDTTDIDALCFIQAMAEVFAIRDICTDWSAYPSATDSAVTKHLVQDRLGRVPDHGEIVWVRERFHSLLDESFSQDPSLCTSIRSGPQFLQTALSRPDWAVAFATGGWEITARLKLTTADYHHDGVPMASSDDADDRVEICKTAVTRALGHYGVKAFSSVGYVGDRVWDARAAHALEYRFVGIGSDVAAELLKREGADLVIPDFHSDGALDEVFNVIEPG